MTPEQLQSTMEFIVEQQAKFEAEIQKLFESDKQLREADERLRQSDQRLRESQSTLTAALLRLAEITEEHQKEWNTRFGELAQAQRTTDEQLRHTDERLSVLINVVEGQLARRRNGKKRRK
jgi:Mg2+ and Co2+ transporter CorA